MIIASTAHYAKFPEAVLEAIHVTPSKDLKDQIDQLKNIPNISPKMHPEIEKACVAKVNHNKVIEASMSEVKHSVIEFLKTVH